MSEKYPIGSGKTATLDNFLSAVLVAAIAEFVLLWVFMTHINPGGGDSPWLNFVLAFHLPFLLYERLFHSAFTFEFLPFILSGWLQCFVMAWAIIIACRAFAKKWRES